MTSLDLCIAIEDCKYNTRMLEASISRPMTMLYTEGFGDNIDKLVDRVKAFFAKLVNNIKVLIKKMSIRIDHIFRRMQLQKAWENDIRVGSALPNDMIYVPDVATIIRDTTTATSDLKMCLGRFKRISTDDFDELSVAFAEYRDLCRNVETNVRNSILHNMVWIPRMQYLAQIKNAQKNGYGFVKMTDQFDELLEILELEAVRIYQNKTLDIAVRQKYSAEFQQLGVDTVDLMTKLSAEIVKMYESPKFK